ncbi:pollen receptor-like kinase 3 [Cornus florida]|uniref:pollen receptor-like kinase 3 n=1 Tax=Cornus florida TaxID=4283 RepID=UPI0028977BF7|nr:pollen receptor-like kinase 3 [Cornus florida]
MAAVHLLLLLFFFFLTSLSLSPLSLSITDNEALLNFKKSLTNSINLDSWVPDTSPCNTAGAPWDGVVCSNGVVNGLNLGGLGLSGTINTDALQELPGLRTVVLVNNSFSGKIPKFNRLTSVKAIYLSNNNFSGEIPSDFFSNMMSLKKLWLSRNKFSGKIPDSLGKITHLLELHLDYNEFSGPIPSINGQDKLVAFDVSHNKLEGEIPKNLLKFNARSFKGNSRLCGQPVGKECQKDSPPISAPVSKVGWVVVGIMGALLLLTTLLYHRKPKNGNFNLLGTEQLSHEVVEVQISRSPSRASTSRKMNLSSSGAGLPNQRKPTSDIVMLNAEKGVFGLQDLLKASAEVLGNGSLGSAYKAVMGNGVAVVVKRMKEMNNLSIDAFDNEMTKLAKLKHPNISPLLGYHYRKEEKLLVCEYVPKGSLSYALHGDRGTSHGELNWATRLKIIQGVARGMSYLHTEFSLSKLPHGNLKSSNVLLGPNNEPLLCDYGFHSLMNNTESVQSLFAYKSPEATLKHQVSPKSDVYCLGIIILEIVTGKFPSQYHNNQKGGTDIVEWFREVVSERKEKELIDPDIASCTSALGQMETLLHIGASCVEDDPRERLDIWEATKKIEEIQI